MDSSPTVSSVHGIFWARKLKQVAISYSMVSSQPRNGTRISCISCIGRLVLYHEHYLGGQKKEVVHGSAAPWAIGCSSVHGILQARMLEWVVISFSRGSSWHMDWTLVSHTAGGFFTIWAREALAFDLPFHKIRRNQNKMGLLRLLAVRACNKYLPLIHLNLLGHPRKTGILTESELRAVCDFIRS